MNTWVANVTDELIDARLQHGDAVRFTITTTSMYPTLAPGDQVIVRRARAAELRVGDVVIIKPATDAARLAHRLIARGEGGVHLLTKGDNCATPDPLWTESQLCGIVIAVWRPHACAPSDWRSHRARFLGVLLAFTSRAQGQMYSLSQSWLRRVALKTSRMLLYGGALMARWIVG